MKYVNLNSLHDGQALCCVFEQDTFTLALLLSDHIYKWVPVNLILEITLR